MLRPGALIVVIGLLALALPQTSSAQQSIGADLNRPVTANYDCEVAPPFFFPTGVTSCTYLGTPAPPITNESTATPLSGVITRVRVKTRAPTGPMRVTVLRQLGDTEFGLACCFFQAESQVFTPRVNGDADTVTSVNVRLPVENGIDVNAGQRWLDYLGITVLRAGTRIPAFDNGTGGNGPEFSAAYYPHMSPADRGTGRSTSSGTGGVLPLLNADFVPLCGARAADARGPLARSVRSEAEADARMGRCLGGVTPRSGSLSNSSASVTMDCNLGGRCRGKLTLLSKRGGKKLGKSKFALSSAARKAVKVKLSKVGRRAAKGKRKLTVKAKARVVGAPSETKKIKLKR